MVGIDREWGGKRWGIWRPTIGLCAAVTGVLRVTPSYHGMARIVTIHPRGVQGCNTVICQKLFVELTGEVASDLGALASCAFTPGMTCYATSHLPKFARRDFKNY